MVTIIGIKDMSDDNDDVYNHDVITNDRKCYRIRWYDAIDDAVEPEVFANLLCS